MQSWGEITVRHNSLRDVCYFRCGAAGIEAERETTGLRHQAARRRPGDVVIHACPGMGAVALDFAVTCPLQASLLAESAEHSLAAARSYVAHKFEDRRTAQLCAEAGLTLVPMWQKPWEDGGIPLINEFERKRWLTRFASNLIR